MPLKLRPVDARPVVYQGQHGVLLRDPLSLAEKSVIVPRQLLPLLALFDGTRDVPAVRSTLAILTGLDLPTDVLQRIVGQLDEALLLENERSAAAYQQALEEFRAAEFRPPASAGGAYPPDPDELRAMLDSYLDDGDEEVAPAEYRGLVSPHIDYARGGLVYGRLWARAREMVRAAELVVIFGTDHTGADERLTLTRQNYATPLGVLPTERHIVDRLADSVGPDVAFADELHHRGEHSVELAAVWLQHTRGAEPCPMVPVLCGSFRSCTSGDKRPEENAGLQAAVRVLQDVSAQRRTLVVAAGDLAHIGPAFGGDPVDVAGHAALMAEDEALMATICGGRSDAFLQSVKDEADRRNVCGVPPIYLALRVLGATTGHMVAYDRCPADEDSTSFVSICGIVLK